MRIDRNERMNPDAAIDRVLTGLAGVEAPPEIEQRVLRAVQRRAAEQKAPRFAALSIFLHWQSWAVAACVVVISFAASIAVRKRHEPKHEDAVSNRHALPDATTAPPVVIAEAQPEHSSRHTVFTNPPGGKNTENPEDINDLDALAIIEMNAPSKPAPPLPLTHQEKLLATAVDHAGPEKLSTLRPEVMAQQMELSKADFHNFFEPPPAKDNE